ncbi:MAG: ferritin-like domain-containing protein [Thermoleophilaceae bacterium]|nr:ferritin-like domain-containing protein [Thermoleophilaceae bacterium]
MRRFHALSQRNAEPARVTVELVAEVGPGTSRTGFLERAVVAGGALVSGGVLLAGLPRLAASAPSPEQDVKTLNFVLLIEGLQARFYAEALRRAQLSGETREFAGRVGEHERVHLGALRDLLGRDARSLPEFDLGDTVSDPRRFRASAAAIEEIGLAAYNGQATNLTPDALAEAAKIASVEARHASWARGLAGSTPAPRASDLAASEDRSRESLARRGLLERP